MAKLGEKQNTYKWVAVSGPAEVTESGADAQIDKLAKKYLGKDEYPWRNAAEQRVKVVNRAGQGRRVGLRRLSRP